MLSLIIPVYKNEANIPSLLEALCQLQTDHGRDMEVVFVVDGSPDQSLLALRNALPGMPFQTQLLSLSRNFGAFAAIRAGLEAARGSYFAVMAADLQEPPALVQQMYDSLAADECDVAYGERTKRHDPFLSRMASHTFWQLYRKFVSPDIPRGGVDIFGCNTYVRDQLLALTERNSSLVGLLFWVGFRRKSFPYERAEREIGTSAWTFLKKWKYMQDSIFSFSDLPISLLLGVGFFGMLISGFVAVAVLVTALAGKIDVPGYAATMMALLFFGMLQILSIGVLGIYVWRIYENTKGRPLHIVMSTETFSGTASAPVKRRKAGKTRA